MKGICAIIKQKNMEIFLQSRTFQYIKNLRYKTYVKKVWEGRTKMIITYMLMSLMGKMHVTWHSREEIIYKGQNMALSRGRKFPDTNTHFSFPNYNIAYCYSTLQIKYYIDLFIYTGLSMFSLSLISHFDILKTTYVFKHKINPALSTNMA